MASRPKIVSFKPNRVLEYNPTTVYLSGDNFQNGATLTFGVLSPALTYVSPSRVTFQLPNSVAGGTYDVILTNPDGGRSNTFEFPVDVNTSAVGRYIKKEVDQRIQPLPPPLQTRSDSQRVEATNQFTGVLPNADQGNWGGTGPTQGGRWKWAEECKIVVLEFMASGAEPGAGRLAGSAFFKVRPDGSRIRLLGLDGPRANDQYVVYEGADFTVAQDEEVQLITVGATLEMKGSVTVRIDRPYL